MNPPSKNTHNTENRENIFFSFLIHKQENLDIFYVLTALYLLPARSSLGEESKGEELRVLRKWTDKSIHIYQHAYGLIFSYSQKSYVNCTLQCALFDACHVCLP